MNDGGIVIDLGTTRYDPSIEDTGPSRTSAVPRWRTGAAALAGLLVLSAGGAAPAPAPPLREVHTASLGPLDTYHLDGDLLVTATPSAGADQPGRRITGYGLVEGRRLWTEEFDVSPRIGTGATLASGSLVISEGPEEGPRRTTAVDPQTGERRWSVPYSLTISPGEPIALAYEHIFAPESRLRPGQREETAAQTYLSEGHRYTEPPIGVIVRAVDLGTGRVRWESPRLDTNVLLPAAADQPAALLTTSAGGGVEVRDLATGAVRHRLDWPGGELGGAGRIGDVVAVWRFGPDQGVVAYSADLRQRRWSRSLPDPDSFVTTCGPVLCWPDRSSTVAIDPATGETSWRIPERLHPFSHGPWLVTRDDDWERLHRIVDPVTGRTAGDLGGWQFADDGWMGPGRIDPDRPPLLLKPNPVAQRTEFGLLDPAEPTVRPLVVVPHAVRGCQVARRFLACRSADGQLRVWRYEPPRTPRGSDPPG